MTKDYRLVYCPVCDEPVPNSINSIVIKRRYVLKTGEWRNRILKKYHVDCYPYDLE